MGKWIFEQSLTWTKLLFFTILCIYSATGSSNTTRSARHFGTGPLPHSKFVTFNALDDKIGIDLDLTIPFLSIPLNPEVGPDRPLINVNGRALTVAGVFTAVSAIVVPLLISPQALPSHYKSSDTNSDWWSYGETMNQILLGNPYIAPCMKKFICSAVSKARHAKGQTSVDKIIDGISSHEWFDHMIEGSAIREAIITGQKSAEDCNIIYSGCFLTSKSSGNF